jgi:O-antigen ligase
MVNTYNYLKNVLLKAKEEVKNNPFVVLVTLAIITIPLHYRYSSIAIMLLTAFSLFQLKNKKFYFQKELSLLVLFYVLMVLSLTWTIDSKLTSSALVKGLSFVLIPVCFFLNPPLSEEKKDSIIKYYSYAFFGYSIFYLIKALIRFLITNDSSVFFYHELVTFDVNAIHVSVYIAIAFFWFLNKKEKTNLDKIALIALFILLFLLSSKNIIIVFLLLLGISVLFVLKMKTRKLYVVLGLGILMGIVFFGKIKDRFLIEIQSNQSSGKINSEISGQTGLVYNVSIKEAWTKNQFQPNDYFPGTALRVYQARIFTEIIQEDDRILTGYGVNATDEKIKQKRIEHNLYHEYDKFNFHNQYIQIFAELGVVGFVLLVLILWINLKNAIKTKHFVHFSFAILMISLFLTESFLSRQRGIVFFMLLFCLFNSKTEKKIAIKE